MAKLLVNSLTTHDLTNREEIEGQLLTVNNRLVLQNRKAAVVESLLTLTFDPNDPKDFAVQHSFLTGQLTIYNLILEEADAAELLVRQNLDLDSVDKSL